MKMSGKAQRLQMMAQANQEQEQATVARAQEDKRQERLDTGTAAINKLFDPQQVADGSFAGFDDKFYKDYGDKYRANYAGDIGDQYAKATENLDFKAADAGTFDSNVRTKGQADLEKQRQNAVTLVSGKADEAAGALRSQVGAQKTALLNQLFSTENPDIAASQALNSVKTIQNQTPDMQPLGEIIKNIAIGGANAYNTYSSPYNKLGTPGSGGYGKSGSTIA
jgi:hypothetical protein